VASVHAAARARLKMARGWPTGRPFRQSIDSEQSGDGDEDDSYADEEDAVDLASQQDLVEFVEVRRARPAIPPLRGLTLLLNGHSRIPTGTINDTT
jgi:hypothetical protein